MTKPLHILRWTDHTMVDGKIEIAGEIAAIDPVYLTIARDQPGFLGRRQLMWVLLRAAIEEVSQAGSIAVIRLPVALFAFACQTDLAGAEPAGRA
ncbi:MAG: hypothetical protein KGQ46_12300 [Hyphomicrobiales bacterium]|nr:hypothetical protein [Hyphomicrobiales bacterium]MDE2113859.1 hypothetical protein [Hyphomicrobiales bacterium]